MFIYTLKASTLKFIALLLVCASLFVTLLIVLPTKTTPLLHSVYTNSDGIVFRNISTNKDRISFLAQYGWTVEEEPYDTASVTIPADFDKIFTTYNTMQQLQGLDLSDYKRKSVTRYTYLITNYPNYEGKVYANLLIYKDRVVGGDVCSADVNGFIHGFSKDAGQS